MKYFLLFITASLGTISFSQNIYGSISAGYLYADSIDQAPSFIINSYHQFSEPGFTQLENISFKHLYHTDLSLGHKLNNNIAYELSGTYLKPLKVDEEGFENVGIYYRCFSGQFFKTSANIVLIAPMKKLELYSKIGVNLAFGKIKYYQSFHYSGSFTYSPNSATLAYEYDGDISIGFNGAIGLSAKLNNRISIYTELNLIKQHYSPSKGRTTEFTIDGVDQMNNEEIDAYESEIEFVNKSEWYSYNPDYMNGPERLHKRSYSLGSYGLSIGVKFILWTKKEDKSFILE